MRLKDPTDAVIELAGYYNLRPLTLDRLHGYNDVQMELREDFRSLLLELPTSASQSLLYSRRLLIGPATADAASDGDGRRLHEADEHCEESGHP